MPLQSSIPEEQEVAHKPGASMSQHILVLIKRGESMQIDPAWYF